MEYYRFYSYWVLLAVVYLLPTKLCAFIYPMNVFTSLYLAPHCFPPLLLDFFLDVALVTSLRDGMNLVSYEYVACQAFKKGVLILSEVMLFNISPMINLTFSNF